jgi:5-(carboxyamino)imidazole ribonucleotide mutase
MWISFYIRVNFIVKYLYICKKKYFMAHVGIIMGSKSDLPIMQEAATILKELGVSYEINVVSAHRTPELMFDYAKNAHTRGIKVIIAGAGGAAHLPGMTASLTPLPVIGVPVKSSNSIDGWDSILSILQMPNGIPVATVALNAAKNAGILAAKMIATSDEVLLQRLSDYMDSLKNAVLESAKDLKA